MAWVLGRAIIGRGASVRAAPARTLRGKGGRTRLCVFDDRFVDRSIDVQPDTGAAFVFDHKILHAGLPVTSGVKYALRTDVMFAISGQSLQRSAQPRPHEPQVQSQP